MKTFKTSEGEIFTEQELLSDFKKYPGVLDLEDINDILRLKVCEQIYIGTEWVKRIK